MNPPIQVVYKGVTYKRNPGSDDWPKRVYYRAPRGSGRSYLHRDVFADTYGAIPRGMHVHHKDHDPFNNNASNLALKTPKEHRQEHARKFDEARMEIFRRTTLAAAAQWHGSEQGIAWHRKQGRRSWENRETTTFMCPECNAEHEGHFPGRETARRYCSSACRQRADRRTRKYWEAATCLICSIDFERPKGNGRPETCSRACGAKLRWQRRKDASH